MRYRIEIVTVHPVHVKPLSLPGRRIIHVLHTVVKDGGIQLQVVTEAADEEEA